MLVAAAIALLLVVYLRPFARQSDIVGLPLPQLELEPLTGGSQSLRAADLRGQVVLLNFWGTWCGPCVSEFPHLVKLADKLANQEGFRMVLISCEGAKETNDELRQATYEFLRERDVSLPTYADPGQFTRRAVLMVSGEPGFFYPTTLILDGQGIIRGYWDGYRPGAVDEMGRLIDELLVNASQPAK
jgi:thiol-disulfide isomerase/thioredoxin